MNKVNSIKASGDFQLLGAKKCIVIRHTHGLKMTSVAKEAFAKNAFFFHEDRKYYVLILVNKSGNKQVALLKSEIRQVLKRPEYGQCPPNKFACKRKLFCHLGEKCK